VRGAGLAGYQVKPRAVAGRSRANHPPGRGLFPTMPRHRSVAY